MPYGMKKNNSGTWYVFNREYMPVGWNTKETGLNDFSNLPIHTEYKGLKKDTLLKIFGEEGCHLNKDGHFDMVFFYNDATNPVNVSTGSSQLFADYFKKIEALSKLKSSRSVEKTNSL